MQFSESIKNISAAMLKLQEEVEQPKKDAVNPFHKSAYATLEQIVEALKPVLVANGLSYSQAIVGSGNGIGVQTLIMHTSGEWIMHEPFVFPLQANNPQGGASASTYARRYSLSAAFGIVPEDDDDGNFATGMTKKQQPQPADF